MWHVVTSLKAIVTLPNFPKDGLYASVSWMSPSGPIYHHLEMMSVNSSSLFLVLSLHSQYVYVFNQELY